MVRTRKFLIAVVALAAALIVSCRPAGEPLSAEMNGSERAVRVFAAASLTDVLKAVGDSYFAEGHPAPVLAFAASSELARQIEQGAEADVFISADEAWMDYLAGRGLIEPASRANLLANRLVLIAPSDRPFQIELRNGVDLKSRLRGGKLAIANPDSVPAGRYAKDALEHFGAWAAVESVTARTENVRATLRFVEAGEAAAGIVYATDAIASGNKVVVIAEFPSDSHTPIIYPAAILAGKGDGPGKAFVEFMNSEQARSVFESAGFGAP